jgi:hypothetical protein
MYRMRTVLIAALLMNAWSALPAGAQTSFTGPAGAAAQATSVVEIDVPAAGVVQRLTLSDGNQIFGQVESIETAAIVFRSLGGVVMTVPRANIVDLRVARGQVVDGEFLPQDSHDTRLMFAPTGRSLRRGEGYVGFYYILPFVQVGLTDRLSVGGGTPLFFGDGDRPVWLTPKLQIVSRRNAQVAVGVIHITGIEEFNAGIAYGVTTIGRENNAATIGLGYAYSGDDRSAILMVGGEHRQSRRIKWITENWFWPDGGNGFVSGGVRFVGERLSADVSLVVPLIDEPFAFPIVSFAWSF